MSRRMLIVMLLTVGVVFVILMVVMNKVNRAFTPAASPTKSTTSLSPLKTA